MQKILVITMNQDYPFFMQRPDQSVHNGSITVRRIIETDEQNYHHVLAKTTFIKNLRNRHLIKVEDVVVKNLQINILYENIQSKFDWRDSRIITQVYGQLKNLTTYLANIGVKTSINSSRIGITQTGILKYYLGLDFQWENDKDDQFLHLFYKNQMSKLFGGDFIEKAVQKTNQNMVARTNYHSPKAKQRQKKHQQLSKRKVSFATLSSRQSRIANIQKQMNMIKSSFQKRQQNNNHNNKKQPKMATSSENRNVYYNRNDMVSPTTVNKGLLLRDKEKLAKKLEDRKFSGDIRNNMMSGKRLEEKESDIRSERGAYAPTNRLRQRQKQRYLQQNNQYQIQTTNSKSRLQHQKYSQYLKIKKSQRNYLQDFISVLQDEYEQPHLQNILSQNTSRMTRPTEHEHQHEETVNGTVNWTGTVGYTTEVLKMKTQEAILNSRKIIERVRGLPSKKSFLGG